MEKKILNSKGQEYITVAYDGKIIQFKNFGKGKYTVNFDANILDQLVPFLNEVVFWRKVTKENENETHN